MAAAYYMALGTQDKSVWLPQIVWHWTHEIKVYGCRELYGTGHTRSKYMAAANCMALGTRDKSLWLPQIVWLWAHGIKVYGCRKLYGFGHTG